MFKLALVVLLCAQAYARPHEPEIESHVVGGTKAKEGDYPFIVSLRVPRRGDIFCGGALLSDRYVVTAAHCVTEQERLQIGAGSIYISSQKVYDVDKIIIHPNFHRRFRNNQKVFDVHPMINSPRNVNDIALLRLKTPIKLGGNIQTINFPVNENLDGKPVTGLGWGQTSVEGPASDVLLYLNRPVINNKECAKRLNYELSDSQICLQGEKNFGMCFGDSGSPLLYKGTDGKNYIAGIVSWGIPCAKGYPDVFTRVSSFTKWIKENMV